jgi:TonB family protein
MCEHFNVLLMACVLLVAPRVFAGDGSGDGKGLQDAALNANVFANGTGAFSLSADLTLYKMHKGDEHGSYKLVWLSANDWRREVKSQSFESSQGVMQGVGWAKHTIDSKNTAWKPFRLTELENLRDAFAEIGELSAADKISMKRSGGNTCWKVEHKDRIPMDVCVNNDSHLISSVGYKNAVYEMKNYRDSGGKKLPLMVNVIVNGMKIVELANLRAENIATATANLTAPPAGAWKDESLPCALGQGNIVKRVAPEYPAIARENNEYGTVVVGILVGNDGSVKSSAVMQSAGPRLDQAALDVVKKWQFQPYECGGHPVEALSDVSIQFNAPHSDYSKGSVPLYH